MSISPAERVTDTGNLMPVASLDVKLPKAPEVDAGTLANVGDAVISAAQDQFPAKDSAIVLSDGRTWGEYSKWPAYVLGEAAPLALSDEEMERTTTDGRKWHGQGGYSTWNPYAGL